MGSACPKILLCTIMPLLSPDGELQILSTEWWSWHTWLTSDCYDNLSEHNLLSTTACAHRNHIYKYAYYLENQCECFSSEIMLDLSIPETIILKGVAYLSHKVPPLCTKFFPMQHILIQCIQIIFKPLPRLVLWTLSWLQFPVDNLLENPVISHSRNVSLYIASDWGLILKMLKQFYMPAICCPFFQKSTTWTLRHAPYTHLL